MCISKYAHHHSAALHEAGILTEDLALPNNPNDEEVIYRGLCHLPRPDSVRRRIDFLTVPWKSRGAALLYYTVSFLIAVLWALAHFISQGDDIVRIYDVMDSIY